MAVIIICFTVLFLFILFDNPYLQNKYLNRGMILLLTCSSFVIMFAFYLFFEKNKKIFTLKNTILILSVIYIGFFILQLVFVKLVYVNPTWDFGVVFRNIQGYICDGKELAYTTGDKIYFAKFGNNKGLLFLFAAILKFLKMVGFKIDHSNILHYCIIINCIFVQLAMWLTSLVFVRIRKYYLAVLIAVIMILSMVFMFYCPIFYTDTISLFIPVLLFHIILSYERNYHIRYLFGVLVMSIIGYFLKLTSIFVLLAYIVYFIVNIRRGVSRKKIKGLLQFTATCILLLAVLNPINTLMEKKAGITEDLTVRYEIPFTHWIMMGMYEYKDFRVGGYSKEAYDYTEQFTTIDRKKEKNFEKINLFFKERGLIGEIGFLLRKGVFTWGDGLFFSIDLLSRDQQRPEGIYHVLYDMENGHEEEFIGYYCTGIYYAALAYLIVSMWMMLFRKKINRFDIIRITIMGMFVFLMIWETSSRYLFHYLPFVYIICVDSIAVVARKLKLRREKYNYAKPGSVYRYF